MPYIVEVSAPGGLPDSQEEFDSYMDARECLIERGRDLSDYDETTGRQRYKVITPISHLRALDLMKGDTFIYASDPQGYYRASMRWEAADDAG